jgi:Na+/melibiose symporter-like transporter
VKFENTQSDASIELSESLSNCTRIKDFILQKYVILPIIFIILFMGVPSYDDPFFYFLTNELKFNGNIMGQISFVGAITAIIAIFMYKFFFKAVSFKWTIAIATILYSFFSFSAYLLALRFNKKLGISDYVMALFSSATTSMLGEFSMMPILSLACLRCPKNLEATAYSIFMSAINFGAILSGVECSFLTSYLGITSKDFSKLPNLILISNILGLLPLVVLLFMNNEYFENDSEGETKKILTQSSPVHDNN